MIMFYKNEDEILVPLFVAFHSFDSFLTVIYWHRFFTTSLGRLSYDGL